jgi:hypothetical protein
MRVRVTFLFLAILFIPALAFADAHKADYYGGGSGGTGGSKVGGFVQSLVFGVERCRWLGVTAADASVQFGGENGKDLTQFTYQFGARVTLTSFKTPPANDTKVKVFVQGGGGWAYTNDGTDQSGANGVGSLGGGIQWFAHKLPVPGATNKSAHGGIGVQAQLDYIWRAERQGYWRASAGVVYRFLHQEKR